MEWSAQEPAAEDTLRVELRMMPFRSEHIRGVIVAPDGPHAPVPPGLQSLPGPGELVVSPALARLLGSQDGKLLRPRLDHPIVGSIGDDGLRRGVGEALVERVEELQAREETALDELAELVVGDAELEVRGDLRVHGDLVVLDPRVDLGPDLVAVELVGDEHDLRLANRFRAGIDLPPGNSAIVSAELPGAAEKLERAGIMAAVRGGRLRTSWHVYNTEEDVDAALAALRR